MTPEKKSELRHVARMMDLIADQISEMEDRFGLTRYLQKARHAAKDSRYRIEQAIADEPCNAAENNFFEDIE